MRNFLFRSKLTIYVSAATTTEELLYVGKLGFFNKKSTSVA